MKESKKDTKQELYNAFLALLDAQSYQQITVTEIVKACNVHRNTFYYHFRDKEDLVLQLMQDETEKVLSGQTAAQSLTDAVRNALVFLKDHEESVSKLFNGINISILDTFFHDVLLHQISLYLRKVTENKEVSSQDVHTLAQAGAFLVEGCLFHYLQNGEPLSSSLDTYLSEVESTAQGTLSLMLDRIDAKNRTTAASTHHSAY